MGGVGRPRLLQPCGVLSRPRPAAPADAEQTRGYLEQADAIYVHCRQLREERYSGIAHPYLAACIHGTAVVAYYQAASCWDRPEPHHRRDISAQAALMMRSNLASAFAGLGPNAYCTTPMSAKSTKLLLKASAVATRSRRRQRRVRQQWVERLVRVALTEFSTPRVRRVPMSCRQGATTHG